MKLIDMLEAYAKEDLKPWDDAAEKIGEDRGIWVYDFTETQPLIEHLITMIRAGAFEDYLQPALNCLNGGVPQPILSQINQHFERLGLPLGLRFWVSEWSGSAQKWNATVYVRNDETKIPTEYHMGGGKLL